MPKPSREADTSPPPAATRAAGLTMFLPGDPGFDPWCLTDPLSHIQQRDNPRARPGLRRVLEIDPEPAKTIALQAEIAAAIEGGIADYLPETPTRLVVIAETCPWPGVGAKQQFVLGGRALNADDRFILSVGPDSGRFPPEDRGQPGVQARPGRRRGRAARGGRALEPASAALSNAVETFELLDWKRRDGELLAEVPGVRGSRGGLATVARCARRTVSHASVFADSLRGARPTQACRASPSTLHAASARRGGAATSESRQIREQRHQDIAFDRIAVAHFDLDGAPRSSSCTGSRATAASSSCPSRTRRQAPRRGIGGGALSARHREGLGRRDGRRPVFCDASPTTRRAATTPAGSARSHRPANRLPSHYPRRADAAKPEAGLKTHGPLVQVRCSTS